ncbi:hypothetical protein F5B20DRAFT_535111 [Whalleya microplaca]|nr:hypothetical protein F5B20DRAFT_535111 [Whalleya microplaca]
MAQAGTATESWAVGHQPRLGNSAVLTATELDEIRKYQKVVDFRDTILSGKHARIQVPSSSVGKATTRQSTIITTAAASSSAATTSVATQRVAPSSTQAQTQKQTHTNTNGYQVDNMHSFNANSQQPAVAVAATGFSTIPGVSRSFGSSKTEINPVLLEKSEDLVKAELQLQRQRLEKSLKEQIDQRKASTKNALPPYEQLPDFDLSDVLAKALTLVQATAPPVTANPSTAANVSDSSDSFDENTFYSSQHDTPEPQPEPQPLPRIQNVPPQNVRIPNMPMPMPEPTRSQVAHVPSQQPAPLPVPAPASLPYQVQPVRSALPTQNPSSSSRNPPNTGGLATFVHDYAVHNAPPTGHEGVQRGQQHQRHEVETHVISSDSGAASRSDNSGNTDTDQPADHSRMQNSHHLLPNAHLRRNRPLIRAHNLSPFAPQPAHVSPLAMARQPPIPEPDISILPGAPAQVTALRQERGVVTSPESSPQGEKGSKKKNKKNKKRKAEARALDTPGSPYIKPEPRSPSPLSAPHFIRQQKRSRPSHRQEQEQDLIHEPQIERPISILHQEQHPTAPVHLERVPYGLDRADDPYTRQVRHSVAPAAHRLDRPVYEELRPDGTSVQYIRRAQSPPGYVDPYGVVEPRPMRSASYSVNPPYREVSAYQRDGRMSVRPYADRARSRSPVMYEGRPPAVAPPLAPPARIIVDQYGREYIDPPRASTVARHSAVPAPRPSEHEVIYERAPIRAPSRMAGAGTFEEDGVVYRRASPVYAPRRVITQPEYGSDYRSYRERDYSIQPMGPPPPSQDFIQIRGATERRVPEDITREYLPRAASVRPAEAVPYYNGLQSSRPDVPPRQYAASVHPEVRREAAPPVFREFSARPLEADRPRREFSVRPVERYYDRPPHPDDEVTYIERPRTVQQEVIYADNSRRQVYQ